MLSTFLAMTGRSRTIHAATASSAESSSIFSALLSPSTFRTEMVVGGLTFPLCTVACYLMLLAVIKRAMKDRQAFDLKQFVVVYNFALSFLSGVLFYFLSRELWAVSTAPGGSLFRTYCDPEGTIARAQGAIYACYFFNYMFKYVELIDTVLLCLRKKQTPFIHVYHHAITLLLCWTQLTVGTCLQWVIITINLFVHIILYSYYALYELKMELWWKKYLTTLQIVQFFIGLAASLFAMLVRLMWDLGLRPSAVAVRGGTASGAAAVYPWSWWSAPCHGSWAGSYFGLAVIVSYLVLFMRLYNEKYKADAAAAAAASVALRAKSGGSNMFKSQVLQSNGGADLASSSRRSPSLDMCSPKFGGVATQEDLFDAMRSAWLAHPLVVAEKERWNTNSSSAQEDALMEEAMPKPEAVLHRRKFGTDADRL